MKARGKIVSLPKKPKPSRDVDGDLAFEARNRALLLTTALNGLRLEEFAFSRAEWVARITPMYLLASDLDRDLETIYRQATGKPEEGDE